MQSVLEILNKCEGYFAKKGVPNAKLDAQILLAKAMKCKRLDLFLHFEDPVFEETLAEFREDVRRRAKREPLQHILGNVEFFGLKLKCDARALIPRSETEELCEILADRFPKDSQNFKILDLGTGSGAIILALKSVFKNAACLACDKSKEALDLARENAALCGLCVDFFESDWFENASGTFDLIVSNPPYLTEGEIEQAQIEVKKFDPYSALFSPENGLQDLRKIIELAPKFLNSGGTLALECGLNQAQTLADTFADKWQRAEVLKDLSGRERFLILQAK